MKINKAKLLVGTLAIASVAATVGSISGTVAWFQYSTRSTIAYSGAAAHVSENLQIRLSRPDVGTSGQDGYVPGYQTGAEEGWKADLTRDDIAAYLTNVRGEGADHNLRPVTSGAFLSAENKAASTFYKSPIYQYSHIYATDWEKADAMDFIELPVELRVLDRNGKTTNEFLAKDVYLTDLTVEASANNGSKKDISPALRVSFDTADKDVTFSLNADTVATTGKLDLNGDNNPDKAKGYDWQQLADYVYGDDGAVEKTTQIAKTVDADHKTYIADDTDPKNLVGNALGATTKTNVFKVTVRIYIEGWQLLDSETLVAEATYESMEALNTAKGQEGFKLDKLYKVGDTFYEWDATLNENAGGWKVREPAQSAIWDDDSYADAKFNVGMRFAVNAHDDATDHPAE